MRLKIQKKNECFFQKEPCSVQGAKKKSIFLTLHRKTGCSVCARWCVAKNLALCEVMTSFQARSKNTAQLDLVFHFPDALMEAMEMCKNQSDFKETITEAVAGVACKPGASITGNLLLKDLCHIKCACHKSCSWCPSFTTPTVEEKCTDSISFQSHQCVHSCSEHGKLDEGSTECQLCSKLRDGEKKGKIWKRRNLVHLVRPFQVLMKDCHSKSLLKCKKHQFLCIILSSNVIGKDREDITVNKCSTHRDHSERLKVEFNNQVQEEHCGGGQTVSLEGHAVKLLPPGNDQLRRDFFTCLSDFKLQDASTTDWQLTHLVKHLKEKNVLKKSG